MKEEQQESPITNEEAAASITNMDPTKEPTVAADSPRTPPRKAAATTSTDCSSADASQHQETSPKTPLRSSSEVAADSFTSTTVDAPPASSTMTTPNRSRPTTPARTDSPLLITPIPSQSDVELIKSETEQTQNDDDNNININNNNNRTCPKWSEVLRTPSTEGERFSPARPLNKSGSLHGLGLMVATDRAKKLSQSGRRCAMLLSDIASLQDTFAQALLKISVPTTTNTTLLPIMIKTLVGVVHRSRVSFAKQCQGLAICVKGSVARPLHSTMTSLGDTAPSIYQRYAATRVSCANARQVALRAKSKYVKAVREAEMAIGDLRKEAAKQQQQQQGTTNLTSTIGSDGEGVASMGITPSTSVFSSLQTEGQETTTTTTATTNTPSWEMQLKAYGTKNNVSTDRLIALLHQVQKQENEYKKLVEAENHAIRQAQTMEVMALEATQKLEEERLQFFVESLNRMLTAEKGALDNMVLSMQQESSTTTEQQEDGGVVEESLSTQEKKSSDFFKKILKKDSQDYEEGIGLMEAATLGLPENVGKLRDEVKSCIAARASRGQVVRALAMLLEEIACAASTLASGIEARVGQEGYGDRSKSKTADPLVAVMRRSEGPNVLEHWDAIVATVSETAASARQLAYDLRLVRQERLDPFLLRVEKDCRTAAEGDDNRWKNLCEAARNETKAEMRYQEANSQYEKARDRVKSVDTEIGVSEHSEGKGKRMNSGVSRALGNVFSILPDGGEQAMQKMLSGDARQQIAKTALKEADERESKEKNALDAAATAKSQSLKAYSANAEGLVFTLKKEDAAGWTDAEEAMKSLLSSFEEFRTDRYNSVEKASDLGASHQDQLSDIADWTARATTHIAKKSEKRDETGSQAVPVNLGFALSLELENSKTVYKLLYLDEADDLEESEPTKEAETDEPEPDEDANVQKPSEQHTEDVPESTPLDNPSSESPPRKAPVAAKGMDLLDSPTECFELPVRRKRLSSAEKIGLSLPTDSRSSDSDDKSESQPLSKKADDAENSLFLAHFWQDREEDEEPPSIIESFSCAYWPKEGEGYLSPLLHGRLFLTSNTLYFVGWGDKKIVLDLADVVAVTKAKNMMGTIDNSLRVEYSSDDGASSYFFGSFAFRDKAFELLQRLSTVARSLREINGPPKPLKHDESALPDVPPDQVIKRMDVVLSKKIKNVSIERFYDLVWSEGTASDSKPFYGPWLESMGSHKVNVGKWEVAESESDQFVNEWCGEKYAQRRHVQFEFTRTTHLYIGPPIAGVKQTHHCSVEGNNKFILAMTVEMDGIPYADCFAVEVRWVARRVGVHDIHVEVGVFVNFKKSTMFAKKIKAGTLDETKPVHHKLFESAKALCVKEGGEVAAGIEEEEEAEEEEMVEMKVEPKNVVFEMLLSAKDIIIANKQLLLAVLVGFVFLRIAAFIGFGGTRSPSSLDDTAVLNQRLDELHEEMKEIRQSVDEILQLLKERE